MPWVNQPSASGPWERVFVFDDRRDQYSEMDTITYEDAKEAPYENVIWTEQVVASGPWA